jgi:hypothetical protein
MFAQLAKTSTSDWDRIKLIQSSFAEVESELLSQLDQLIGDINLYKISENKLDSFSEYATKTILGKVNQWVEKQ